jgi:hypothetical protein
MSSFENRLWSELARAHGHELAQTAPYSQPGRRRLRPRLVIAASTALAAAALAVTLAATVSKPVPAYAVRLNSDGSVTLRLDAPAAASAANARLSGLGVRARVVVRESGCVVKGATALFGRGAVKQGERQRVRAILSAESAVLAALARTGAQTRAGALAVRIRPDAIPPGDTLVLTVRAVDGGHGRHRSHAIGMSAGLYRDPAPRCLPLH